MMSDHVKRGATKHTDREITTEYDAENPINGVWCCTECNDRLEVRQRKHHAYVTIECSCGANSLDLMVADLFDFEMESWDTVLTHDLDGTLGDK